MGGPHFRLTRLAGQPSMLGGGPAYLILNRRLYLGLSGSYLEGNTDELMIGYGGPSVGWQLFPDSRFGLWLGATAALGGLREPGAGSSGMFVLEPEAIAQLALGPSSRLGLGASYRWALPFEELPGYGAGELSGPSLVVRLDYGVFPPPQGGAPGSRRAAWSDSDRTVPPPAPVAPRPPRRARVSLAGTWSQKFSLVRGQLTRFDGGCTRLLLKERWALGAMGCRAPGGTKLGANDFQMMEGGFWIERLFDPSRRLSFSIAAFTGIAMVGYLTPAEEMVGSPAFVFSPEALGCLALSDFVRLSAGLGYRTALPFGAVPGLEYWDCNGPTDLLPEPCLRGVYSTMSSPFMLRCPVPHITAQRNGYCPALAGVKLTTTSLPWSSCCLMFRPGMAMPCVPSVLTMCSSTGTPALTRRLFGEKANLLAFMSMRWTAAWLTLKGTLTMAPAAITGTSGPGNS